MPQKILYVAFVWNQHQPYYLDKEKGEFIMPWVRLHATKDYFQMAAILEDYPEIRQTFSLSPSLIEQIETYTHHNAVDYYLKVMKKAKDLNEGEKRFLLQHYFDIQWDKVICRYDFYRHLLERQGQVTEPEEVEKALERFATQDYLDLQVWFNLVWIDPEIRSEDLFLKGLMEKGRNFSEADKEELIKKHFSIMEKIIPEHKRLQEKGQIEIITTAYYHPIVPLLIDNHSALRASPGLSLPKRFRFENDARTQVKMTVDQYYRLFGTGPRGFWPPEQAVSPEMLPLIVDEGFKWTISDEQILAKSMDLEIYRDGYGHVLNPEVLYRPYLASGEGAEIPIIFRDHHLSDRIGFVYQHMSGKYAAEDLIHRLHKIRENLGRNPDRFLVTLALDGENAWEWYPADKTEFLHHLYQGLTADPYLQTVTVSDYLEENPPKRRITHLATGSWVDHSLTRWIGTENKNLLWNYLLEARETIKKYEEKEIEADRDKVKKALENIYIAEGSDYPWWVDSMPYYLTAPFEALFRKHLIIAYNSLGLEAPGYLSTPSVKPGPGEKQWQEHPLSGPVCIVPGRQVE
ncbi:MAG: glycoside hydrolase family 57 protein [Bacillota bacterium]|nr:glycoside hydrolase family 57 protein [Bacillota bacterium]